MAMSEISDRKFQRFLNRLVPNSRLGQFTMFGSCNGSGTSLHFDREPNQFLQLGGTRRFQIFPPQYLSKVHIAPVHHPHHRQSLIQDENFQFILKEEDDDDEVDEQGGWDVELSAGEALFIPPFFLHRVISTSDDSLGMAIDVNSSDPLLMNQLTRFPLPFERDWDNDKLIASVSAYIEKVLSNHRLAQDFKLRWEMCTILPESDNGRFHSRRHVLLPEHTLKKIHEYAIRFRSELDKLVADCKTKQNAEYLLIEYSDRVVWTMFHNASRVVDFVLNRFHV